MRVAKSETDHGWEPDSCYLVGTEEAVAAGEKLLLERIVELDQTPSDRSGDHSHASKPPC